VTAIRPTKLEEHLDGDETPQVTPLDVLLHARRKFLRGRRIDMQELASELGLSRATLYRWVGTREKLIGEVIWSLGEIGLRDARAHADEQNLEGVEWILAIYDHWGQTISNFVPIQKWAQSEPEVALRVLTSHSAPLQRRAVEHYRKLLEETGLEFRFDTATLAYVLVRIGESFLWADLITGESQPDLTTATDVARVLLS
jgi:AcrR family transcriptional regulator